MAAGNEEVASLLVVIEANANAATKEIAKLAKVVNDTAKKMERDFVASNDNSGKSFKRLGDDVSRSMKRAGAETSNLAAQFQDIGVSLQSGTSPLTVALQQGTQIGAVLQQAALKGQNAFQALGSALMAVVSPVQLLTIAAIAGGAALVQMFLGADTAAQKNIDALEKTIAKLKDLKGIAEATGATTLTARLGVEIDEAQVKENLAKLQAFVSEARNRIIAPEQSDLQSTLNDLDQWFNKVARSFGEARGWLPLPVDAIGDAIRKLTSISEDDTGAKQIDALTLSFVHLQDAIRANDIPRIVAEMEKLGTLNTDALDPERVKAFFEAWDAGGRSDVMQEYLRRLRETKPAIDNIKDSTDAAQKKQAEYIKAMDALQGTANGLSKHEQDIQKLFEAWATARASAKTYFDGVAADTALTTALIKKDNAEVSDTLKASVDLIKKLEGGFQDKAFMDKKAISGKNDKLRIGFSSDTFVDAVTGQVRRDITEGLKITEDQAMADLVRRTAEYHAKIEVLIGSEFWRQLTDDQKAALASIAYNYNTLPDSIVKAIKSGGGPEKVAAAIAKLTANPDRRMKEAKIFGGDAFETAQKNEEANTKETQSIEEKIAVLKAELDARKALNVVRDEEKFLVVQAQEGAKLDEEIRTGEIKLTEEQIAARRRLIDTYADYVAKKAAVNEADSKAEAKHKKEVKELENLAQAYTNVAQQAVSTFVQALRNGESAGDAFLKMIDSIIDGLINMAIQALFSKNALGGLISGAVGAPVGSSGGKVGYMGVKRNVSPWAFAGAPRMARGGFVGVGPGEYPTILHRGEVVIPAAVVRSAGRAAGSGSGGTTSISNKIGDISIDMGANTVGGDTQKARDFGRRIQVLVQTELTRQSQPGGMLTATGSAGRVGR